MSKTTLQENADFLSDLLDYSFVAASRFLRELQDEDPDEFARVVKHAGLGLRKAYHLARIHRQFAGLGADIQRLEQIGWTKLQLIGGYIKKSNADHLLGLAEQHTVYDLARLMRGKKLHPVSRFVLLHFSQAQYDVYEKAILDFGAKKSGKALIGQEAALTSALSQLFAP